MPPRIFNVGLFLGRRYWNDVKGLFCVSDLVFNKWKRLKMTWKVIFNIYFKIKLKFIQIPIFYRISIRSDFLST